jgi:hypothetical protein
MNTNTWSCGTPKSQSNAFNWKAVSELTPEQILKAKQRQYSKLSYEQRLNKQGRTRTDVAMEAATRVNAHRDLSGGKTNSETAPR